MIVELSSEEYGTEGFEYDGIEEALAAVRRLWEQCCGLNDGVERRISVVVDEGGVTC